MLSRKVISLAARSAVLQHPLMCITSTLPARNYAQATRSSDTRPPVAVFGLDGTYASALYTAAVKTFTLESTSKALSALLEVFKRDPKLSTILNAPTLTPGDKSQIIQELQRHTGVVDKGDTVKNLLKTLADNNRLGILEGLCEKFTVLIGAAKGELDLTVTSASRLDAKTLQRLETAVAKSEYSYGKKLKVIPNVNSEILGGLILEIGDRTIDLSVSSKISRMNKLLTDTL